MQTTTGRRTQLVFDIYISWKTFTIAKVMWRVLIIEPLAVCQQVSSCWGKTGAEKVKEVMEELHAGENEGDIGRVNEEEKYVIAATEKIVFFFVWFLWLFAELGQIFRAQDLAEEILYSWRASYPPRYSNEAGPAGHTFKL